MYKDLRVQLRQLLSICYFTYKYEISRKIGRCLLGFVKSTDAYYIRLKFVMEDALIRFR